MPSLMRRAPGAVLCLAGLSTVSMGLGDPLLSHTKGGQSRRPCYVTECTGAPAYIGCFKDGAPARMMNAVNSSSPMMTLDTCVQFCVSTAKGKRFNYAGLENGDQCFCGDAPPTPGHGGWQPPSLNRTGPWFCTHPSPDAKCNVDCYKSNRTAPKTALCCCPGDLTEVCGSVGLLQVYDVSTVSCGETRIAEPYCDPTLTVSNRIDDLLDRMTLEEKIGCITTGGAAGCTVPRLGIEMTWAESLHGLRYNCISDLEGRSDPLCATSFPHAQLLAATFNRSLWHTVGTTIAQEARAFYNLYASGRSDSSRHALSFFAPDINLCRDPRWGRCLEVPGEDPVLAGEYGVGYVGGMQAGRSSQTVNLSMAVCNAKHWSAYDVESGSTNDGTGDKYNRGSFNAEIPLQDLIESYWAQFTTVVREANLGGTMCSYNAVNGIPSCANGVFNNDVLRKTFGFAGMIVSDCGAVAGIMRSHNYTHTTDSTVRAALEGGTDLNCGTFYLDNAGAAIKSSAINTSDIDTALRRVFAQFYKVGLGENPVPWSAFDENDIDTSANRAVALDAARQGMVLLRNEGSLLPLMPMPGSSRIKMAVLGPHIHSSTALLANYYGQNTLVETSTPLEALLRRPEVSVIGFLEGCNLTNASSPPDIAGAVALAAGAEVAVVFVGLHSTQGSQVDNGPGMEREGFDRTNLTLPGFQQPLIEAIHSTGTPTVVVFINSGGVAAEWVYSNVPAILEAYYPGELGGDAIASLLLGDTSPSGRLTTSIYPADYVSRRNITDMDLRPHGNVPGATYRFMEPADTLFSFGFGLHYTAFHFGWLGTLDVVEVSTAAICSAGLDGAMPTVTVATTNMGRTESDVSVLCFVISSSTGTNPIRQLAGFTRTRLVNPNATISVNVTLLPTALRSTDVHGSAFATPQEFELRCGGEPDGFAATTLRITGPTCTIFEYPQ